MSSLMNYRNEEDGFAFTKQTAMILEGLGIGNLIPQFKNKNISTEALSQLSKNDFITLGVNDDVAETIVRQLTPKFDRKKLKSMDTEDKSQYFIDIIKSAKSQLIFLQAFMSYTRLRLLKTPADYIIDSNNNLRASKGLCIVASHTLEEINILEEKLKKLSVYICENDEKRRRKKQIFGLISGISLSVCLYCSWYYAIGSLRRF